uniref:Uncharacterized protein n=1 Tax=Lepeophtheirus salmonis TaxID=72036 RepID=A0A0K2UY92_LEPSM
MSIFKKATPKSVSPSLNL